MKSIKINWHGPPCPEEHLEQVEAELDQLLHGPLESPQQMISHLVFLPNGGEVTAWGETSDDYFHAEYHDAPTKKRADKALEDRIRQLYETDANSRKKQREDGSRKPKRK